MKKFDAMTQLINNVPHLVQRVWMVVVLFLKYFKILDIHDLDSKLLTKKSKTDRPNISNIRHMCPQ